MGGGKLFVVISIILLSLNFISSGAYGVKIGSDDANSSFGVNMEAPAVSTFNNNTATVNDSQYWMGMGAINTTQMEDNSGTLNILESWITGFGNGIWCALAGCTMAGDIDMGGNDLLDINQLITSDGSKIRLGTDLGFVGFDQAMVIQTNQVLGAGTVTHSLLDAQGGKVIEAWQSGKNNSAGFHRNSYLVFGDQGSTNGTFLTNAIEVWEAYGIEPEYDYDTANQGAALGVQYGIETQKLHLHDTLGEGEFSGEGAFKWLGRDGTDFDIYDVPLHLKIPRQENVTFGIGDVTLFDIGWGATPAGTLPPPPFTKSGDETGSNLREWSVRNDARCNSNPCARAKGGNGGDIRGMDYNFTTLNISAMDLSLWYGSDNMDSGDGDGFTILMNNNEGSGWVVLFNDTTTNADISPPIFQNYSVPGTMENKTVVTLRFNHYAEGTGEESFVDNIKINGTAGTPVVIEVTRNDARIEFGGSTYSNANCEIYYNDSEGVLEIGRDPNCAVEIYNATFTNINVGSQNVTGDLIVEGNVTADYFIGDGSLLTGVGGGMFETDGSYIYNLTTSGLGIGIVPDSYLLHLNHTDEAVLKIGVDEDTGIAGIRIGVGDYGSHVLTYEPDAYEALLWEAPNSNYGLYFWDDASLSIDTDNKNALLTVAGDGWFEDNITTEEAIISEADMFCNATSCYNLASLLNNTEGSSFFEQYQVNKIRVKNYTQDIIAAGFIVNDSLQTGITEYALDGVDINKRGGHLTIFDDEATSATTHRVHLAMDTDTSEGGGFLQLWNNSGDSVMLLSAFQDSYILSEKLGIGTESPDAALTVQSTSVGSLGDVVFEGSGINDATFTGVPTIPSTFRVEIDGLNTSAGGIVTYSYPFLNTTNQLGNYNSTDNLTFQPEEELDADMDYIYDWRLDGSSIMPLIMPLSGGSNTTYTKDYSSAARTPVLTNATYNSTGGHDSLGGYDLTGVNSRILLGTDTITDAMVDGSNGGASFEFWAKPGQQSNTYMFDSEGAIQLSTGQSGSNVRFTSRLYTPTVYSINTGYSYPIDQWHHVVFIWNATNQSIYVNGQHAVSGVGAIPVQDGLGGRKAYLGANWNFGTGNTWNGSISEFNIYSRKLSADQILALYQNRTNDIVNTELFSNQNWSYQTYKGNATTEGESLGISNTIEIDVSKVSDFTSLGGYTYPFLDTGNPDGDYNSTFNISITPQEDVDTTATYCYDWRLEGSSFYQLLAPFEEDTGGQNTTDYSSNGNNGTIIGATYNATDGFDGGGAFELNADDARINFGSGASFDTGNQGPFTAMLWYYPYSLVDYGGLINKESTARTAYSYILGMRSTGKLTAFDTSSFKNDIGAATLTVGEWNHVAYVITSTRVYFYINGALNSDVPFSYSDTAAHEIIVGDWWAAGDATARGLFDDIRWINKSVNADFIEDVYTNRTDLIDANELSAGQNWNAQTYKWNATVTEEVLDSTNNITIDVSKRSEFIGSVAKNDTFKWYKNEVLQYNNVEMTGLNQPLSDNIQVRFDSTTDHTMGVNWSVITQPEIMFKILNRSGSTEFLINSFGYVGIGVENPTYPLVVNKTNGGISAWFSGAIYTNGTYYGSEVYDKQAGGNVWDWIKDSRYYEQLDGKIDHRKFYGGEVIYYKDVNDPIILPSGEITYNLIPMDVKNAEKETEVIRQGLFETHRDLVANATRIEEIDVQVGSIEKELCKMNPRNKVFC